MLCVMLDDLGEGVSEHSQYSQQVQSPLTLHAGIKNMVLKRVGTWG